MISAARKIAHLCTIFIIHPLLPHHITMTSNLTAMQICNKADLLLYHYVSYPVLAISDIKAHLLALPFYWRGSSSRSPPNMSVFPKSTMRSYDETQHMWRSKPTPQNISTRYSWEQKIRLRKLGKHLYWYVGTVAQDACGQRGNERMLCVVSAAMRCCGMRGMHAHAVCR